LEKKEKLREAWKEYKKSKQIAKRVIFPGKGKKQKEVQVILTIKMKFCE